MRLLLDTHAFILFTSDPDGLPNNVRTALEDSANELLLSMASPWEMQIKSDLGKLRLGKSPRDLVEFEVHRGAIAILPITLMHIDELSRLPSVHRDPFDRLIIAQARCEQLRLVSGDTNVRLYPVDSFWE